jgi:hypothetical protein
MKYRIKNTLREMAKHFSLKLRFVDYFDDQTHGKLLVREKRILLNARKSRIEHVFTILHELGHYVLHYLAPRKTYHPKIFESKWLGQLLPDFCRAIRRYFRFIFNNNTGLEWEADLWAMCAFVILAKQIGCRKELMEFLKRHPEKTNLYLLAAGAFAYDHVKTRAASFSKCIWLPLTTT